MESTESPFSDKMIAFFSSAIANLSMQAYGIAVTYIMRKDILSEFAEMAVELGAFAKEGFNIMIDYGWLEKLPQTVNRKELIGV